MRRWLPVVLLLLLPGCAFAQGVGFINVAPSIPGRTQCTQITSPVVGRTWCADGNDPFHWRVWNGTTYECLDCGGSGTVTGTGTTHTLPQWTNGPGGVVGDSIVSQDVAGISVVIGKGSAATQFLRTDNAGASGALLVVEGGDAAAASNGSGGSVTIQGGAKDGTGGGGIIELFGSPGTPGGQVNIVGGNSVSGAGGFVAMTGGTSPGVGGAAFVSGGPSSGGAKGGSITLTPGTGTPSGDVIIAGIKYPLADGTINQVLATNGAGQLSFVTAGSGTVTGTGTTGVHTKWTNGPSGVLGDSLVTETANTLTLSKTSSSGQTIVAGNAPASAGANLVVQAGSAASASGLAGGLITIEGGVGDGAGAGGGAQLIGPNGQNGGVVNVTAGNSTAGVGGSATMTAGTGSSTGGQVSLLAGNSTSSGVGGAILVTAGNGATAGSGGQILMTSGNGAGAGNGGAITFTTGTGTARGNVAINTGSAGTVTMDGILKFTGSSSGSVGLKAAAAAGSTTFALPAADGSNGWCLVTNGAGQLSFANTCAGGSGITSLNGLGAAVQTVSAGTTNINWSSVTSTHTFTWTGQLSNVRGGTGQDSSAWSALPLVTAGTWSQYAGSTCGAAAVTAISASGVVTCTAGTAGTVTSFSAGNLSPLFTTSVATATTTPALSFTLSNAASHTVLSNVTGGSTTPSYNTVSSVLDTIGGTQGQILYRDAANWNVLAPGTLGQLLQTNGAGANPTWVTAGVLTGGITNRIAYWTSPTTLGNISAGSNTTTTLHGGSPPTWSHVNLSLDVVGNLPVANLNSGTGANATTFWRGDGTWAPAASGCVGGGRLTISGSNVVGTVTFATPMADALYAVALAETPGTGTPPFVLANYDTVTVNGFNINLSGAPGTGNSVIISWIVTSSACTF